MTFQNFAQTLTQKTVNPQEKKAPKYNTQLFGQLDTQKTTYNAAVGCDMYIVANVPHFKTGKANDKAFEGFETIEEAYNTICLMAKAGVPGIWHIGQDVETKKFCILKTIIQDKNKK